MPDNADSRRIEAMKLPTAKDEAFRAQHGIYPWERFNRLTGLQGL
jgi:hypothetical protein